MTLATVVAVARAATSDRPNLGPHWCVESIFKTMASAYLGPVSHFENVNSIREFEKSDGKSEQASANDRKPSQHSQISKRKVFKAERGYQPTCDDG